MTYTNPPVRDPHPVGKTLTEQTVPSPPGGATRWALAVVSLLPAFFLSLAVLWRMIGLSHDIHHGTWLPLLGIYGLIGSNLAVIFFVGLALKGRYLDPMQRLEWAIANVFLAPVSLPIFWYRHVLHPLRYGRAQPPVDAHEYAPTPQTRGHETSSPEMPLHEDRKGPIVSAGEVITPAR
jgi:hypothetical protein